MAWHSCYITEMQRNILPAGSADCWYISRDSVNCGKGEGRRERAIEKGGGRERVREKGRGKERVRKKGRGKKRVREKGGREGESMHTSAACI